MGYDLEWGHYQPNFGFGTDHLPAVHKDQQARTGEPITRSSSLFPQNENVRKEGSEAKYDELLNQNKLLLAFDLIKNRLPFAYSYSDESQMEGVISWIMDTCRAYRNSHFQGFVRLLCNNFEGIFAHVTYKISSGKMESINNEIKVLRRQAYVLPDDDYYSVI